MSRKLLTCGEHAVLVELGGLTEVLALDEAVRASLASGDPAFADVVDIVPAARTLLVVVREGADLTPVRAVLPTLTLSSDTSAQGRSQHGLSPEGQSLVVEIGVHYDGPDLEEVAELTGLTAQEVMAAHTQKMWRVAFAGFAPGFAYLTGGDSRLQVPRRSEPRTSVPAGSVGLASEFSAVYPRSSPGGWQLLGHTDAVLWDVNRQPPALLQPGSMVRFVDVDAGANVDVGAGADVDSDADGASR